MAALTAGAVLVHNLRRQARHRGDAAARPRAMVIGTASAGKRSALRAFGVDHAIDYQHGDVEAEVKRHDQGRGVDVILDPIGGASFTASYRMLAPLGRRLSYWAFPRWRPSAAAPARAQVWWAWVASIAVTDQPQRGIFGLNLGHLWDERGCSRWGLL